MLNPPSLPPPPQLVPPMRPVAVPVPVALPTPAPVPAHSPSPTVVNIPLPQHLMRHSLSSLPSVTTAPVPVPAPVVAGRIPPPLVPDHLHIPTSHLTSPTSHPTSLPVPTPVSAMNASLPLPRQFNTAPPPPAQSSVTMPSLPVPPALPFTPTPAQPSSVAPPLPSTRQTSAPVVPALHAPVPGSTSAPPQSSLKPTNQPSILTLPHPTPPTPSVTLPAAGSGPTVTILTPHSSTTIPPVPLPVPTPPCSTASQSLSVPPPPPLIICPPTPFAPAAPTAATIVPRTAGTEDAAQPTACDAPRPPQVQDLPRRSYCAWVYPKLESLPELATTTRVGFLGTFGVPRVLLRPVVTELGSDGNALQDVPQPIGPAYIVFGGARYDSLLLAVPKPPFRAPASGATAAHQKAKREEARRVRHLTDQLDVARDYLRLTQGNSADGQRATRPDAEPSRGGAAELLVDTSDVVAKRSIWNAAFGGSPSDLSAFVDADASKELVESVGYVVHARRQWGLKRNNEVYELGLGQKGTPLQFAAISGKVDNVLLLLASGARDNQRPLLKDLLPEESYKEITAIFKPPSARKKKRAKDAAAAAATETPTAVANSTDTLSSKAITLYAFEMVPPHSVVSSVNRMVAA